MFSFPAPLFLVLCLIGTFNSVLHSPRRSSYQSCTSSLSTSLNTFLITFSISGISFLALYWAVKPDSIGPIYLLATFMGVRLVRSPSSVTLPKLICTTKLLYYASSCARACRRSRLASGGPLEHECNSLLAREWFVPSSSVSSTRGIADLNSLTQASASSLWSSWAICEIQRRVTHLITCVKCVTLSSTSPFQSTYSLPWASKALLFQGVFVFVTSFLVFGLRGRQSRKEMDLAGGFAGGRGRGAVALQSPIDVDVRHNEDERGYIGGVRLA